MITEEKLSYMIDQLNLALNDELDHAQKLGKNIKSLQIKRAGFNWVLSFWYGDRFKVKAFVRKTK